MIFFIYLTKYFLNYSLQPCNVSIDISRSNDFTDLYLRITSRLLTLFP